ncbi:MAG: hypothetical protein JW869_08200 [Candidatus Omnitrophica bacterium]|nr:hypothetical protein [Candidatus Omnitrophota bacterium]
MSDEKEKEQKPVEEKAQEEAAQPKAQAEETKPKELNAQEEKPAEKKEAPEKAPAAEAAPPKEETQGLEKKKKKINRLTLKELEKKINEVQEKMGSLSSSYARGLLRQKEQLLSENAAAKGPQAEAVNPEDKVKNE